jgi:hypothetical protein
VNVVSSRPANSYPAAAAAKSLGLLPIRNLDASFTRYSRIPSSSVRGAGLRRSLCGKNANRSRLARRAIVRGHDVGADSSQRPAHPVIEALDRIDAVNRA